jgi:hypothetical protein
MGMTVGEIQFANRAIGCMERVADALEGIQSVAVRKDDPWKAVAQRLAALYEARAVELTLNEDEVSALMAVAKLSKGG